MARRKTTRLAFDALMVEGALIAPDMIADVAALKATAQSEADYRIPPGLKLRDEIGRSWRIAEALWARFSQARGGGSAYAATLAFVDDLLRQVFGFVSLEPVALRRVGSRTFPVQRIALSGRVPITVAPAGEGLDRGLDQFAEDHRKRSASLVVQECLNADEAASWGLATDGLKLRLLRDNASLTRPAYVEADLERIFQGRLYADFVALWLLVHESRFGASDASPIDSPLERWREAGREAGAKARDRLGLGVEEALKELGAGFLEHAANSSIRERIQSGAMTSQGFYEELLRFVYRLIFLFTTEDRGLLHDPAADEAARTLYADGYSLSRLRTQAARRAARDENHDLYEGLKVVFRALWRGEKALGLPALGGLFRVSALPTLVDAKISNRRLLEAIFRLAWIIEDQSLMRVNWRDMETEELGSVYEALLELTPRAAVDERRFYFAEGNETKGNARKTSGSYYTPDSLVQLLLSSALDPVIERTVNENPGKADEALLDLSIIDPACGSGHFLLAAGRRLATRVAQLRSPNAPSAEDWRHALREVARRCLFGVDRNPMAVELCQTALWIESVDPGKPLTFLSAHIVCGDSLIGVWDLAALRKGVPDDAYKPLTGDDKGVASAVKKVNKAQRDQPQQKSLFVDSPGNLAVEASVLEGLPEDDLKQVEAKAQAFERYRSGASWLHTKLACDLYVAAFFRPKVKRQGTPSAANIAESVPTTVDVWAALDGHPPERDVTTSAIAVANDIRAFHWPLTFPQVLAKGGFSCVVGNPPWERIKLQEEEFFATRHPLVATAKNKAERGQRIGWLAEGMLARHMYPDVGHPDNVRQAEQELHREFFFARRNAEAASVFAHVKAEDGGRYPLTGVGDVNTYALFAETFLNIAALRGRAGFIVPTGIATDETTKGYFDFLIRGKRLVSLISFENEEFIFQGIANVVRFSLLTIGGEDAASQAPTFCFYIRNFSQLQQSERMYQLSAEDIEFFNPNSRTAPIFRSKRDAELTRKLYGNSPIARTGGDNLVGGWSIRFMTMFHMANDSDRFRDSRWLEKHAASADEGSAVVLPSGETLLPLYEGKFIWFYNHRFGSYHNLGKEKGRGGRGLPLTKLEEYNDPNFSVVPEYWISEEDVKRRISDAGWDRKWLLGFRDVTSSKLERTFVPSIVPFVGVGHKLPLLFPSHEPKLIAGLLANLSSLPFDYVCRQKIGGISMSYSVIRQLAFINPARLNATDLQFIVPRVIELTYTAYDLKAWANDLGYEGLPFRFDTVRRAKLRAELDAFFARMYGLDREELCYILDPSSVLGTAYPSETFRVLKQNEEKEFGEYRTQRLVLAAWDALENGDLH